MKTQTDNTASEQYQSPLAWWGKAQEKSAQLARWMSLYEAVNIIADKAEEKKIPIERVEFKPLDIRDYMTATEDIFLKKILQEDYKIQICYSEDPTQEIEDLFPDVDVDLKD